jgi:hypothetical protein
MGFVAVQSEGLYQNIRIFLLPQHSLYSNLEYVRAPYHLKNEKKFVEMWCTLRATMDGVFCGASLHNLWLL